MEETGGRLIRLRAIGESERDLGVGSIAVGGGEELLISQGHQGGGHFDGTGPTAEVPEESFAAEDGAALQPVAQGVCHSKRFGKIDLRITATAGV